MTDELIQQLNHPKSSKRRSAAKKLQKLGDTAAGHALLEALKAELKDRRTWETQYQMIRALAECDYREALPFLRDLAAKGFEATMVSTAIGDAIVRLSRKNDHDVAAVFELMESGNDLLIDGALRVVAMLHMVPGDAEIERLIGYAERLGPNDGKVFWIAAAAPGWSGEVVQRFLEWTRESERADVREAAEAALQGRYRKWAPL